MISLFLGVLAGISLYAAFHHLQIALHLRWSSPNLLLAVSGVAFAALALTNTGSYLHAPSIPFTEFQRKAEVSFALLGLVCLYVFVGLRAGTPRKVLWALVGLMAAVLILNQFTPAGLMIDHVTALEAIRLPWGDVYNAPIGPPSPFESWILYPVAFGPLLFLAHAIRLLRRQGRFREARILLIVLFVPAAPAFVDLVLMDARTFPLPTVETALTATLVLLSMLESSDVAQTASLEDDLLQSEERFRHLVEDAPEAIGVFDLEQQRYVAVNRRAAELTGVSEGEIIRLGLEDLLARMSPDPAAALDRLSELLEEAETHGVGVADWWVKRGDGTLVPCEIRISTLAAAHGSLIRVSLLDMSAVRAAEQQRKDLENRLEQAQKLETLGTLAGGIAHDFNNMLTPIVGFGELAMDALDGHPARDHVSAMSTAAFRAQALTQRILTFSRQNEVRTEPILVQSVVEQALGFLRAALPARVQLVAELDAPSVYVIGDEVHLHQVVMSLGTNAAHAMASEGHLRVALFQEEDSTVTLAVSDTGRGMPAEVVGRIFDPFFTTKEVGEGSGLGLSVVHGIVSGWNGTIGVETAPGEGTTFRITLPVGSPTEVTC